MTWKNTLKQELKLSGAEALRQLGFSKNTVRRVLGLSPLEVHILSEREKVTTAFWYGILRRDRWTCYLRISPKCPMQNWENKEQGKPKMQVEHVIPVSKWGYTTRENCKAACQPCNLMKGVRIL